MRRFTAFLIVFILCVSILPVAFASAVEVDSLPEGWRYVDTAENLALGPSELVQVTEPPIETTEPVELVPLNMDEVKQLLASGEGQLQSAVSPVTPSDTNGFKKIMIELLGDYDPVVVEYSYQSSQGYTSYLREIQPDYTWLCSCAVFLVVLYCIFRIFGMVIGWKR